MQTRRLLERGSVAGRISKGQAEKAQKADAALRAAIAYTAERPWGPHSELLSPTPRLAVVLAIGAHSATSASALCAFPACPSAIRSATARMVSAPSSMPPRFPTACAAPKMAPAFVFHLALDHHDHRLVLRQVLVRDPVRSRHLFAVLV